MPTRRERSIELPETATLIDGLLTERNLIRVVFNHEGQVKHGIFVPKGEEQAWRAALPEEHKPPSISSNFYLKLVVVLALAVGVGTAGRTGHLVKAQGLPLEHNCLIKSGLISRNSAFVRHKELRFESNCRFRPLFLLSIWLKFWQFSQGR